MTECYPIFKNLYQTNIIAYTTCRNIINNQPDVAKVKCPDASCTDTTEMFALKNAAVCSTECSNAFVTECFPTFRN